ncbi:1403_t:CDS:2 [Dentiscutata erythropus]|uniref:1403_t:CDS:1 n=1 Tax=Dentiscutata erythropus TaxID=1348616 RepID=A0A9N9GRH6_9GLOM|nr:1403_t:CDS:2 [Dentiscutata erythropus]
MKQTKQLKQTKHYKQTEQKEPIKQTQLEPWTTCINQNKTKNNLETKQESYTSQVSFIQDTIRKIEPIWETKIEEEDKYIESLTIIALKSIVIIELTNNADKDTNGTTKTEEAIKNQSEKNINKRDKNLETLYLTVSDNISDKTEVQKTTQLTEDNIWTPKKQIPKITQSIENSIWASKGDACKNIGEWQVNILSCNVPDNNKDERFKYVKWILQNNKHIKNIKEVFEKGNYWYRVIFDCQSSCLNTCEYISKKEGEWLYMIPNTNNPTSQKEVENNNIAKLKSMSSGKNDNTIGLQNIILWDLPKHTSKREVLNATKFLGQINKINIRYNENTTKAIIMINNLKNHKQIKLDDIWSIPLNNTYIDNIPKRTNEVLLKRSIAYLRPKALHIFNNSNRNQKSKGCIDFENKRDLLNAQRHKIIYKNTRIYWSDHNDLKEQEQIFVEKEQDRKDMQTRYQLKNFPYIYQESDAETGKAKGSGLGIIIRKTWEKHIGKIVRKSLYYMSCMLYFKKVNIVIILVYLTPNNKNTLKQTQQHVIKGLQEAIDKKETHYIILGDFNCNPNNDTQYTYKYNPKAKHALIKWLQRTGFIDMYMLTNLAEAEHWDKYRLILEHNLQGNTVLKNLLKTENNNSESINQTWNIIQKAILMAGKKALPHTRLKGDRAQHKFRQREIKEEWYYSISETVDAAEWKQTIKVLKKAEIQVVTHCKKLACDSAIVAYNIDACRISKETWLESEQFAEQTKIWCPQIEEVLINKQVKNINKKQELTAKLHNNKGRSSYKVYTDGAYKKVEDGEIAGIG